MAQRSKFIGAPSCYYNPEVGRFINSDDVSFIGATGSEISYNPFSYCENNPVNGSDPSGFWGADIHYGNYYIQNKNKTRTYADSLGILNLDHLIHAQQKPEFGN